MGSQANLEKRVLPIYEKQKNIRKRILFKQIKKPPKKKNEGGTYQRGGESEVWGIEPQPCASRMQSEHSTI